jgi:hypothetical protein
LTANGGRRASRSDLLTRAPELNGRIDGPTTLDAVPESLPAGLSVILYQGLTTAIRPNSDASGASRTF